MARSVFPMIRDLSQLPAYVPGTAAPESLKISSNEMAHNPLESVQQVIADTAGQVNRYPDLTATSLRTELANYLGVAFDQVAVGCGSSALCQQVVQATCQDGDEVVFPWRSFEAYPIFAHVAGATPVPVPLTSDFRHDFPALLEAVTDRTRLVFLCNPNNPTGTTFSTAELEEFLAKVPKDVVVALDEAYIEFADGFDPRDPGAINGELPNAVETITKHDNVVVLRTFSKVWGLAGLRVGYAFGPVPLIDAVNRVAIPFSVNMLAQTAAVACLRPEARDELLNRVKGVTEQRLRTTEAINGATGVETVVTGTQANFVWIPEDRIPALSVIAGTTGGGEALTAVLAERLVNVRHFPGEGIRITVTTGDEVDRLLAALQVG